MHVTGYGGGFNERENLVYNEREESDGEYDEVSGNIYIYIFIYLFLFIYLFIFIYFKYTQITFSQYV